MATACGPNDRNGNGEVDAMVECSPDGSHRCNGATLQTCTSGAWATATDCNDVCIEGIGCAQCVPGQPVCKDGNVWMCDANGNPGTQTQACEGATLCVDGGCVNACDNATEKKSYIGCEYWAADLDNAIEVIGLQGSAQCSLAGNTVNRSLSVCYNSANGGSVQGLCDPQDDGMAPHTCPTNYTCSTQNVCVLDAQRSPFAIVVSNPQPKSANVTVTGPAGQTIMRTINAGQVTSILPQMGAAIPDQSIDGSVKAAKAYKVTSDLPIVAYQFNPLDNANVFSNDASLLIPRTAFGSDYYVITQPTLNRRMVGFFETPTHPYYGYLTVVAWEDGTQITVTPTTAVQAGQTQSTIAANATTSFTLNAFEVLQLQASGSGDLSGTHIVSTNMKSFGVFGGHEAGSISHGMGPSGYPSGPCCADHLEEMLFPSTTWGRTFAIARSEVRKDNVKPPDFLRIVAQKAGTAVTFVPAATTVGGNCGSLGPGQYCDVTIAEDTEITATEPVLIGHFLEAGTWSDGNPFVPKSVGSGDPSMALAVPTEQFRKDYTILIPSQYAQNFLSISAPATGGVTVDNMPITLTPFTGGGTHRAARVPVTAGQHTIKCADGCGVLVYGYSSAVSYMFAGGLDLTPIVIL
jgi:hypothetical protein